MAKATVVRDHTYIVIGGSDGGARATRAPRGIHACRFVQSTYLVASSRGILRHRGSQQIGMPGSNAWSHPRYGRPDAWHRYEGPLGVGYMRRHETVHQSKRVMLWFITFCSSFLAKQTQNTGMCSDSVLVKGVLRVHPPTYSIVVDLHGADDALRVDDEQSTKRSAIHVIFWVLHEHTCCTMMFQTAPHRSMHRACLQSEQLMRVNTTIVHKAYHSFQRSAC